MKHQCHANGCEAEAHLELPLCKRHFGVLPEAHRKRLWSERPKGRCGVCSAVGDEAGALRSHDWNMLANLGIAIVALVEAPEYEPEPETTDEQGFCWVGGIQDAEKTVKTARAVIKKFNISNPLAY